MKRVRDEVAEQEEASRAEGMGNLVPHHQQFGQYPQGMWGSQQRGASPTNFLPPLWGYAPLAEYVDDDVLGGFNPNITFPLGSVPPPSLQPRPVHAIPRVNRRPQHPV
ncbi:hypothetical protein D1007_19061 [Hordeum vulgare]|nr:hypothetical protein D1007_19061 [Hordeum vulgare]